MKASTKYRIKDRAQEVKGKAKANAGPVTSNPELEAKSQTQETIGRMQQKAGQVKNETSVSARSRNFQLRLSITLLIWILAWIWVPTELVAQTSGPISAYPLNAVSGTIAADSSGNGIDGTLANGATWTTGKYGNAVNLNGTNQYVNLGNPTALQVTGSMTISGWIRASSFPWDDAAIVSKRSNTQVGYQLDTTVDRGPRTVGFKLTSSSGAPMERYGVTVLSTNTWYHVAGVYDAAAHTIDVYVNGQLDNGTLRGSVTSTQLNSTGNASIGQRPDYPGTFNFAGTVDEVRIYSRALTQSEIQADMVTPLGMNALPSSGADTQAPTVPTNLTATGTSPSQISLSWMASSDNVGVSSYLIQRCQGAGCTTFTKIATVTGTSYIDSGLSALTTYTYLVSAQDVAGNSSAPSAGVQSTTQPVPVPVIASFSANPSSIISGQSSILSLSVSNATSLSVDNGVGTVTGATSISVHPATTTVYHLTATNSYGSITSQSTLTVTPDTVPPTSPNNLTSTPSTTNQIYLSWNASTDNVSVTGYLIERCQGSGCTTFTQIAAPMGVGTSYSDSGLTPGLVYSYRVRATDAAGNSGLYSNVTSATIIPMISGLVSSYSFNEGIGTTASDSSGNGLTATLTNGASWITGKYGNAVNLNGTNQYVNLGNPTALQVTGSMTISGWIRANSFPWDDAVILSKRSNTQVGYQLDTTVDRGPRTVGFKLTSSSGAPMERYGVTVLSTNTWYHVAGVYDAAAHTIDVYVNGQLDSGTLRGSVTSTQQNSTGNASIGQRPDYPGTFNFAGMVDEVRIYSRALTQSEIQTDMMTPLGITPLGSGADTQAPTAPTNLIASGNTGNQINLSWTASSDNSGVAAYLIERCAGSGCTTFTQITTVAGTATTYIDTSLSSTTTYLYRVRASDAGSNLSAYSNVASTTTAVTDTMAPTAPPALTANAVSASQINLSWTASTDNVGVTAYRIERCQGAGCTTFAQIAAAAGTATAFSDTGLSAAITYRYQVRASDAASNLSSYSEIAVATTYAALTPIFPLKVSSNGRYLVDQNDQPFMIVGDSPQGLISDLSTADAEVYFANRASHGFNAVQIHIFGKETFGGRGDYSTYDGITPFMVPGDITTPRESYFARVDAMLNLAAQHGIVVFLTAAETVDSLPLFRSNGVTNSRNFGQYLGNRYKNFDNVVWDYGNDFQTWSTGSDNAVILAVAEGIKDNDSRHLHTAWLNYFVSASRDSSDWAQLVGADLVYTYYPTYAKTLSEYALSPAMPAYLGESNYEGESIKVPLTTPEIVRRQEYWTMTSGATGSFYGNYWTWPFRTGWQAHYDSPGAVQMSYYKNLFQSRSWWKLVPDASHQVLTAGYGKYDELGAIDTNDYATAALASDSSFMIAYLPSIRTVTINMTKFPGPVTARWFDPSNGTYSSITGSPLPNTGTRSFGPSGNNSDGNGDWVLVLESTPTP